MNTKSIIIKERTAEYCVCCGSKISKKSPAILMPFVAERALGWKPVEIDESWGLNTIKKGMAYTVCNTLYCEVCCFVFLDIRFSDSEISSLYYKYRGKDYVELREKYEPGYISKNNTLMQGVDFMVQVEGFLSSHFSFPIRILDWGGDTGKNTPFKSKSKYTHIYDISDVPVVHSYSRINKEIAYSTTYDLIVCSNVLEHLPYPSDILLEIKPAMQKDTMLYIEVPFEEIMRQNNNDAYLEKKHWHEHINFFSEKSLFCLLNSNGFSIVDLKTIRASSVGSSLYQYQILCKLS